MKKHVIFLITIFAFVSFFFSVFWWYSHHNKADIDSTPTIDVRVATVVSRPYHRNLMAVGTTIANHKVIISPEVAGHIKSVQFKDGDRVEKGQLLFELEDNKAHTNVASAKANYELAYVTYQRVKKLSQEAKSAIAKQELDKDHADLMVKKAEYNKAKVELAAMHLQAPFAGRVADSQVTVGDFVHVGQACVELVDDSILTVKYALPEIHIAELKSMQPVTIKSDVYPQRNFQGKVTYIAPGVDTDSHMITVAASIDNHNEALKPGLFVHIQQSIAKAEKILMVPDESIISNISGTYVYKVVAGKALLTPVTVGERDDGMVEVKRGLRLQDQVIIAGQESLPQGQMKNGVAVTILNDNKKS